VAARTHIAEEPGRDQPLEIKAPALAREALTRPAISKDAESLYRFGHFIRTVESRILDLFGRGLLSGTTHTCIGQEICQISVVRALDHPDDVVLSNHRNHGHFLTYSGDAVGLIAEVMGRRAGVCGGYGGSQHIAFRGFHSNGIQAGMTGIGVGIALDRKLRGSSGVVAVMVGDGTLGEGLLYESMNLASIWKCPVLFVIENNGIAQTTETAFTIGGSIEARGAAFGLRTWRLSDASPDFCGQIETVVSDTRASGRTGLLVIDTCRMGPHSKGDDLRTDEEKARIRLRDPLAALGRSLNEGRRMLIETENENFVADAEREALASPEARLERSREHAFKRAVEAPPVLEAAFASEQDVHTRRNVRVAINQTLRALLELDPRVILLGEDLHEPYGGAFKVTAGLSTAFADRVISTPISEAGIVGAGIGLALEGRRPVVELMFADFLTLAMDQIYNHAVKFPAMFKDVTIPLVIRTPAGGRRGYGPTHSQNPENLLVSVPGLTVLFGSHRHDVGRLLFNAVERWPNPTVFLEHKLLYGEWQDPGDYETVAPDLEDPGTDLFPTLRSGSTSPDVTIVTFGGMLPIVERAAERLAHDEEIESEVIVPALLAPLPRGTLLSCLIDREAILVVEESHHHFGVSAELVAMLSEAGFSGRLLRVGTMPIPIPSARSLERELIPDEQSIVDAVIELLTRA
jgi:2-oxoisovalerate dehydrogenase E1 component